MTTGEWDEGGVPAPPLNSPRFNFYMAETQNLVWQTNYFSRVRQTFKCILLQDLEGDFDAYPLVIGSDTLDTEILNRSSTDGTDSWLPYRSADRSVDDWVGLGCVASYGAGSDDNRVFSVRFDVEVLVSNE